jgi:hypothetical protein
MPLLLAAWPVAALATTAALGSQPPPLAHRGWHFASHTSAGASRSLRTRLCLLLLEVVLPLLLLPLLVPAGGLSEEDFPLLLVLPLLVLRCRLASLLLRLKDAAACAHASGWEPQQLAAGRPPPLALPLCASGGAPLCCQMAAEHPIGALAPNRVLLAGTPAKATPLVLLREEGGACCTPQMLLPST